MLNLLYFYISNFRSTSMCAVPNMAVFCSSLISCFPVMLLRYFLKDFQMVPVAPIISGITFVFTFHMRCISIVRYLHSRIFSAFLFITFLFPEIAASISTHVPFSLSQIMTSGLLLQMVLSVCSGLFHNMVTLHSWLLSANFGTCSYHCSLSSFTLWLLLLLSLLWYSILSLYFTQTMNKVQLNFHNFKNSSESSSRVQPMSHIWKYLRQKKKVQCNCGSKNVLFPKTTKGKRNVLNTSVYMRNLYWSMPTTSIVGRCSIWVRTEASGTFWILQYTWETCPEVCPQ